MADTLKVTFCQKRPPAPVEAERSTVRLLQELNSEGRLSTTVGYRTRTGGWITTLTKAELEVAKARFLVLVAVLAHT